MNVTATDTDRLLVKIARLYYEENQTQAQMAARLRLSRQKVQRLLQQARDEGVVHINVRPILGARGDLERDLAAKFGLREAVVVETVDYENPATVAREVGTAAAEYLLRILAPGDRMVISWGSALLGLVNALSAVRRLEPLEELTVIQGLGGLGDPNHDVHASELTRRLARLLRGQAILMPAPGAAGTRAAREALCNDTYVARALEAARGANVAVMGIGVPRPDSILVQEGNIVTWTELKAQQKAGAVGDINLRYFDATGRPLHSAFDERVVGLSLEELRGIDHVVAVAGGDIKFEAIQGALRGKFVDVIVTDHVTAERLMAERPVAAPGETPSKNTRAKVGAA